MIAAVMMLVAMPVKRAAFKHLCRRESAVFGRMARSADNLTCGGDTVAVADDAVMREERPDM